MGNKIVCFGDSLTDINAFGYSWTETFQELRPDLEIINSGKYGGMTTDYLLPDKKSVDWAKIHNAVERYDPDVVLITLGGNDVVQTTDTAGTIFTRYKYIVQYLRGICAHVVMGVYDMTQEQCDQIYKDGWHNHSKAMYKIWFSTYSQLIRSYGSGWVVPEPIISLYRGITVGKKIPQEYLRDPVHLSPLGAQRVGEYVSRTLHDYLTAIAEE